jgi:hypothetical protein
VSVVSVIEAAREWSSEAMMQRCATLTISWSLAVSGVGATSRTRSIVRMNFSYLAGFALPWRRRAR